MQEQTTRRSRIGILCQVLGVLVFPLGLLVWVTITATIRADTRAEVATEADQTLENLVDLVALQSALATESQLTYILQRESTGDGVDSISGVFELDDTINLAVVRQQTDEALDALDADEAPFRRPDLVRVRQTVDLDRQLGTIGLNLLELEDPLSDAIEDNLNIARRLANQLNDNQLFDSISVLEVRVDAYLASTTTIANLTQFWFANSTEEAVSRTAATSSHARLQETLDLLALDNRFTTVVPMLDAPGFEERIDDVLIGKPSPVQPIDGRSPPTTAELASARADMAEGIARNNSLAELIEDTAAQAKGLVEARRESTQRDALGTLLLAGLATLTSLITAAWFARSIVTAEARRDELERKLVRQASIDYLTGLPNRRSAMERLREAIRLGQSRTGDPAVIFLDLDRFKWVNDTLGHKVGDELLVKVSDRLRSATRIGDLTARLGGDEFLVVLASCDGIDELTAIASQIVDQLSAPYRIGQHQLSIGASAGLAIANEGQNESALLHHADIAAYAAKASDDEEPIVAFTGELRAQVNAAKQIEYDLAAALSTGNGLDVHYQPQVDTDENLIGFEALIRWTRDDGTSVSPAEFVGIAERSDLVTKIGGWVLDRALADLRVLRTAADNADLTVSVNFSGRHVVERSFADQIREALEQAPMPTDALVVEVTETVLVQDTTLVAENLAAVRALGCRVSIDDFGTGYTSINQLLHVPADEVKLDRSLLSADDDSQQNMAALVVQMANTLELTTVAEGVETEQDAEFIRAIGCDVMQGFHYARPMPLHQALEWITSAADRKACQPQAAGIGSTAAISSVETSRVSDDQADAGGGPLAFPEMADDRLT